jgi:hypothetical protein
MIRQPTELIYVKWDQNNVDDPGKEAINGSEVRSKDGGKEEVVRVKE